MKMGALFTVAQGSAEPPRMIVMTYNPPECCARRSGAGAGGQGRDV